MDRDEKIMNVFKRAAEAGRKEITAGEIALMTGLDTAAVYKRVNSLKKSGEIFDGDTKKSKYLRANPQLL